MPDNPRPSADAAPLGSRERGLAAGDCSTYARLRDDAVMIVPGPVLDKAATIKGIDAAGGWDWFEFEDERESDLAGGISMITYRFSGRRGGETYQLTGVYRRVARLFRSPSFRRSSSPSR